MQLNIVCSACINAPVWWPQLTRCFCSLQQRYPWGANTLPEDRKLTQKITGNYSGPGGDLTPVPDFYQMFAVGHNKPMAIVETAALFNTQAAAGGVSAYQMKIKWLEQVIHMPTLLKLIACVKLAVSTAICARPQVCENSMQCSASSCAMLAQARWTAWRLSDNKL